MTGKLVLIDGHSILNRAFYGVPLLTNSSGLHTNGIYGFLNIFFKIIQTQQPDYVTVAFDVNAPTFRHDKYKDYKGTRKPMPQELREQVPVIKDVLAAMGLVVVEKAGLEADDILGTLARVGESSGLEVAIVSGDRDLLQLATGKTKIIIPKTKQGKTQIETYYEKDVIDKYQVTPGEFIDLKALMGDTADNIPGVPSIGEKTATKIITEFKSIENAYKHIDQIKPPRAQNALRQHYDLAVLSKDLATIRTDCELDYDIEDALLKNVYTKEAYNIFTKLGFKKLLANFDANDIKDDISDKFSWIVDKDAANEIFDKAQAADRCAVQIYNEGEDLIGTSICFEDDNVYFIEAQALSQISFFDNDDMILPEELKDRLIELIDNSANIASIDIKNLANVLKNDSFFDNSSKFFDVQIAAYLINPISKTYDYEYIAAEYLSLDIESYKDLMGRKSLKQAALDKHEGLLKYACYQAYTAFASEKVLTDKLKEQGVFGLFTDIEMPLAFILSDMQRCGIYADKSRLANYSAQLSERISELEDEIYEQAQEKFNINSPKQLGVILFEKLGLPCEKKTKSGYSTAADVLEKLAVDNKIVQNILEYRQLTKLKSTYADGLVGCIAEDGRIHTTFQQTSVATGRLSSTEPNLQNIPIRMELGRLIRKAFLPKEGYVFIDGDYSQIELRVLAHMSGDENLIEAYKNAEDIHAMTASKVFNVPLEDVTPNMRRDAKAVNFGIIYGISSFGLSQDLNISRISAQEYIDKYFITFPKIKSFLDSLVGDAKNRGYSVTAYGRRRPIPEIKDSNYMKRKFGERVAMNAPIQGTAADIIKIAMINTYKRLKEENLKSRLILQVHDELLIEAAADELETVKKIMIEQMENAASLKVRLAVDVHTGSDWYEAK